MLPFITRWNMKSLFQPWHLLMLILADSAASCGTMIEKRPDLLRLLTPAAVSRLVMRCVQGDCVRPGHRARLHLKPGFCSIAVDRDCGSFLTPIIQMTAIIGRPSFLTVRDFVRAALVESD